MPELPEVETIALGLARELQGARIDCVEVLHPCAVDGDPKRFAREVAGRTVTGVSRRGKALLLELDDGRFIGVHLRMTGRLVVEGPGAGPGRHTHLVMDLADGRRLLYSDTRKFGSCRLVPEGGLMRWPFYAKLGPEPLELPEEDFAALFKNKRARVKSLLLDQKVLAGVGNIYADESLFRAGVRPDAIAERISAARLRKLCRALKAVLAEAIEANGSSISDYVDSGGNAGAFQNDFRVYGRAGEPCRVCEKPLAKCKVAGRTTIYCGRCQT
jgi:formamidopyrimidine-DNA glycosylase